MNKLNITGTGIRQLTREESKTITGGGDILSYLKCVSATMTSGGGGIRSFLLGITVFGMARICGVMTGCADL